MKKVTIRYRPKTFAPSVPEPHEDVIPKVYQIEFERDDTGLMWMICRSKGGWTRTRLDTIDVVKLS